MPVIDFKCIYGINHYHFTIDDYVMSYKDGIITMNGYTMPHEIPRNRYMDFYFKLLAFEKRVNSHNCYGPFRTKADYVASICTELISLTIDA